MQSLWHWWESRLALRELRKLQRSDEQAVGATEANPIYRARLALSRGDRRSALQLWYEARDNYPGLVRRSPETLDVLLDLRCFDEAEELVQEAKRRAPRELSTLEAYAKVAERRGEIEEASRRWAEVRRRFPNNWKCYVRGAACLRDLGLLNDAGALANTATRRFPEIVDCWTEFARIAEQRMDWTQALARWDKLSAMATSRWFQGTQDPHGPAAESGAALALQELGRPAEANERLDAARRRYPANHGIVLTQARIAEKRGDVDRELQFWEVMRTRFPLEADGYRMGALRLRALGRHGEGDAVLVAAIERFPQEPWPIVQYAMFAHDRKDWCESVRRWEALRQAYPGRAEGFLAAAQGLDALGRHEEASELRAQHAARFPVHAPG